MTDRLKNERNSLGSNHATTGAKLMGRRYDGKLDSLAQSARDSKLFDREGNYVKQADPIGRFADSLVANIPAVQQTIHGKRKGRTFIEESLADVIMGDLDKIIAGSGGAINSQMIRNALRDAGFDPDFAPMLSLAERNKLHERIVRSLQSYIKQRSAKEDFGSTYHMLLAGRDNDPVVWASGGTDIYTTAGEVRANLGMTVYEFMRLGSAQRIATIKDVARKLKKQARRPTRGKMRGGEERVVLYQQLRTWAEGPLRLEHAQASSFHHMLTYDINCGGSMGGKWDQIQCVVVENDWGAAVPPVDGEWRVPFPLMCWEFRLSGVRVLAFTDEFTDGTGMFMWTAYGRDGVWVVDDYYYRLGEARLPVGRPHDDVVVHSDLHEFRRVAEFVYNCIRSLCIMLDADVAHKVVVRAPTKLAVRAKKEGHRAPPRDHYVVKLIDNERRSYSRVKIAGHMTDARAPQRGHWRKGTWVHYDDPNSGQVQYPNEGGFIVSKSWRKWHFAGDPKNIIHREFRA